MTPDVVVHADWSANAAGRWAAVAVRDSEGRYELRAPHHVEARADPLGALIGPVDPRPHTVLVGLDVVIGLPRAYARAAGIDSFRAALPEFGAGPWRRFFDVAEEPDEVDLRRPFYPHRPRGASKAHLAGALGLDERELLRRCDRPTPDRPGGAELFWTIGGKQVGKASLAAWRELLQPLLAGGGRQVRLWPFDGEDLARLLDRPGIVVAETYPAEAAVQIGVDLGGDSKRDPEVRRRHAGGLLAAVARLGATPTAALRDAVVDGFEDRGGDDAFDSVIGLLGMLGIVLGARGHGAPDGDDAVRAVEGWILGLDPADVAEPELTPAPPPRGTRFVVARNPDHRSNLPWLLSVPVDGGPLLLKARDRWPRTNRVYCHPLDAWPLQADEVESADVLVCERRGTAIDLVLDRAREKRSQFVFTRARGRQMIFWQTSRTAKRARPGVRIPAARASGQDDLVIVADSRERYAYRFSSQQATTSTRSLPAGDYAVEVDDEVAGAVERKSLDDLAGSLVDGSLPFILAELARLPRAAVVVEADYADLFRLEHVSGGFVADQLARTQVRYPSVPIVFCGNRKLGEEWTYRFLGAARAEAEHQPPRTGGSGPQG